MAKHVSRTRNNSVNEQLSTVCSAFILSVCVLRVSKTRFFLQINDACSTGLDIEFFQLVGVVGRVCVCVKMLKIFECVFTSNVLTFISIKLCNTFLSLSFPFFPFRFCYVSLYNLIFMKFRGDMATPSEFVK